MCAAVGANDVLFINKFAHFSEFPAFGRNSGLVFDKFISSVAGFAGFAVHKRVGESADMAGSYPNLGVHKDRGVKTYVIGAFLNECFPPSAFYVVFEFNTERAVVPGVGKTAVNFRTCVNKAAAFAKCDDFFHCFFGCQHILTLLKKVMI